MLGVKIPNARVGLGGTRAFTLKATARLQNGQRRAGKKEGVLGERNFCPPVGNFGGVPARRRRRRAKNQHRDFLDRKF